MLLLSNQFKSRPARPPHVPVTPRTTQRSASSLATPSTPARPDAGPPAPGGVATTVTAPAAAPEPVQDSKAVQHDDGDEEEYDDDDDEGSFFELDLSVRASSSSAGSASSDDASSLTDDLDFVISLHRSRSASPSFHFAAPPPKPGSAGRAGLRSLSFAGATTATTRNAALYGGRRSSFARSSGAGGSSARSLRLFMDSPVATDADADAEDPEPQQRRAPSRDVIRRYLTKISTRLRRSVRPRRGGGEGVAGLRHLRKSRSASAAVTTTTTATAAAPSRRDDSLVEQQDGIASAIAHCKDSLHRASLSMSPSSECALPRSRSDPGNRQAP